MNHQTTEAFATIDEVDSANLLAKIALHEKVMDDLIKDIKFHIAATRARYSADDGEKNRDARGAMLLHMDRAEPERWAALGRTSIQQGLMFLTRAVAQPER